jgi:hypothetical protein
MARAEAIVDRFDEGAKQEHPQSQCFSNFFSRMPLSQYETFTRTTITIQNMHT